MPALDENTNKIFSFATSAQICAICDKGLPIPSEKLEQAGAELCQAQPQYYLLPLDIAT